MVLKSVLKRWGKPFVLVLALLCVVYTLSKSKKDAASIPTPHLGWLLLAVALFLIHYLIQAFGWHALLRALGQPARLRVSMRMYYLSIIARWMPGRVWYSATRLYLAREAGISVTAVTFAIVLELIYIMLGGLIATFLFAGPLLTGLLAHGNGQKALVTLTLLVLVFSALVLRPASLLWMCRYPFFRKVIKKVAGEELTDENMPRMSTTRSLGLLAYYTIFWIYSGVMFGVLAGAFLPMSAARWLACIPAFAGSWLIGFFSIIPPAGLGIREGAMWFLLKQVMAPNQAIVLGIASRLMMLGTELLSVGIVYIVLRGAVRLPAAPAQS